jgi:predicted deacylase
MTGTLITSEVDFDAEGKHSGYLRVPHSTHRSAYGWIPVPITVIRNGDGPTLVISAGVHGDEYEGQIAVANLARELDSTRIRGRLILLPMVNFPAAEAGCRVSPLDDGNLNRLYPGDPKGTPSEMIAHYHEEVILPLADYAVDLHSGGSSLIYPPTLLRGPAHSPEEEAGLATLTEAFDLPYAWVFTGGGGREQHRAHRDGRGQPQGRDQRDGRAGWRGMRDAGRAAPDRARTAPHPARLGHAAGLCMDAPGDTGAHALRIDLCRRVRRSVEPLKSSVKMSRKTKPWP